MVELKYFLFWRSMSQPKCLSAILSTLLLLLVSQLGATESVKRSPGNIPAKAKTNKAVIVNPHDFNYILNNENLCKDAGSPIDLFIWVHSGPKNVRRRIAMRETWANPEVLPSSLTVKIVFFLGAIKDDGLQSLLHYESQFYGDIVQETYEDSYRNLTYKAISGLKWIKNYCPDMKLILKTDDDMMVRTSQLFKHLGFLLDYPAKPIVNSILCDVWINRPVERAKGMKWSVSTEEYKEDRYPTYCPGLALLMSPDLVPKLYYNALRTPYFWVDDVFFTGLLVEPLNVTWYPMGALFHYGGKTLYSLYPSSDSQYIFAHVFSYRLDVMYYLWQAIN